MVLGQTVATAPPAVRVPEGRGGPVVVLDQVVKRFGVVTAVDHLSLDIVRGEFFSMLGPSGCGKTTTLRMIGGFEAPNEGTIGLDGRDVTELPAYRRDVNTVFQSYGLFPHLNVFDNVAFGLRRRKVAGKDEYVTILTKLLHGEIAVIHGRSGNATSACSSGSRWPGRWSTTPRSCSSTSRLALSISSFASRCSSSSNASRRKSESPSSS